ncbi:hypothetical protein [Proteiniclasticum sp. QWL-01]|uniref:hypothetical protein n=1 Tax=Proteiniclasticum sp. QWL-01 TaxID=3036945 RepID=UPI00240EF67F|nr:hypothetical protein [Proteiniclasticum sp. QWL-01]WFF72903.1 hypothetical protein P6M73_00045 [Proteiniclasticum sp. QWL-01]
MGHPALLLLGGMFWAGININSLPMVLEMAGENELGTFTGYYYFFSFSASIASPILFGLVRDLSGSFRSLFVYAPIAFALALLAILQVTHAWEKNAARRFRKPVSHPALIPGRTASDRSLDWMNQAAKRPLRRSFALIQLVSSNRTAIF